jgi:polyisoprenyl-teichoic acid--peptidoglycan teichoic acid transferase
MRKSYIALGIVMVLFLVGLGVAGKWWNGVSGKVFVSPGGNYPVKQAEKIPVRKFLEDKTPLNLLVLGYGGGNHEGPYLTDSMILANLDPIKKRVTLISIPRDIWVKNSDKYTKINSVYQAGIDAGGEAAGGKAAEEAVTSVLGLQVDYFVGVDFRGFVNSIDTLGGADVNVEVTFDDTQYPIDGKEDDLCGVDPKLVPEITATASATTQPELIFPCRYEHLHFDRGLAHMDGATALKYVRSRHAAQDGNDFGRSRRQKNLILAVKQKVMAVNFLPKLIPFVSSLGNDVRTDMSPDEAKLLIQNAVNLGKYQVVNLALTDENYLNDAFSEDGQYILVSRAGQDNFSEIHNWITGQLITPTAPAAAMVKVENGTTIKGLAQKAVVKLKELQIQTTTPDNAKDQSLLKTTITIWDENIDPAQMAILKKEFGVTEVTAATEGVAADYNVLVTLGQDYQP